MNKLGACLTVVIACLLANSRANAGLIGPCDDPVAYGSAVNVYVLEDGERKANEGLRDVRRRLAWLAKLDTLFRDSYGSLGVHFLSQQPSSEPCTLDDVIGKTLGKLPQWGAAVFVEQRVYREGDQILVQSYLRFFRVGGGRRAQVEDIEFVPGNGLPRFVERLHTQHLSFPPRVLAIRDLVTIEQAFGKESLLYPEPRASGGTKLPLSSEHPIPFLVTEARPDGWMRINATQHQNLRGWLRVDLNVSLKLRELLPELAFLEGIVGYLSWRQAREGRVLKREAASGVAARADKVLGHYIGQTAAAKDSDPSAALAVALRTAMALDDTARVDAQLPALVAANQRSTPDSRLRDFLGIARLAACCRQPAQLRDGMMVARQVTGIASALGDFQGALAIDPGNPQALANLEAIYAMIGKSIQVPVAKQAPEDAPAPLRDVYSRVVGRLPTSRAELDARVAEIRTLRAGMPDNR